MNLGSSLASKIVSNTTNIEEYLQHIPCQLNSLVIKQMTPLEIDRLIKSLPNKSSHGHDQISNIMLKSLRTTISFPLCHIFNNSIYEGSFPDLMKRAEVIPLYKGKEMDYMINYRPISLLITLSKLLEKVIYKRLYSYFESNNTLFISQYGFRSKHSCEEAILEFVGHVLQAKTKMSTLQVFS